MAEPHEQDTVLTDMATLLGTSGRGSSAPSTVAGRYHLHRLLGSGGVADVHEATDTRLDRRVAVKLLRDSSHDETDRARFLSEARLLARLSHPHLVRVLDAGIDRGRPFLVLDLVRGSTLADALHEPLAPARVAELAQDIASALAHVHAAGVVHRDVKPGNVLVDEDGSARLADFGIARLVDDTCHHTRTGMVVGTVAYLAPEQVAGERITTAVDIYSLGLVLLEALTGDRPFAGTSVESAFARLSRPPEVPPGLPGPWTALLTAMTARDPVERPTAAEVVSILRAGEVVAAPPTPLQPAGRPLSARLALIAVAAAFLLLLGVAGWGSLPGGSSGSASAVAAYRTTAEAPPVRSTPATQPAAVPATVAVTTPAPAARHHVAKHHRAAHHRGHHHRRPHHSRPHHRRPHHKPKAHHRHHGHRHHKHHH
jgi:eukaryotic-like serine/threonine-protein kinase